MQIIIEKFLLYFQENPIAQSIGFIALFINIIAFATSKDKRFLIFMALSSFFWWIHFFYMWLSSAAYINLFDVGKNLIAIKYKKNTKFIIFFVISYLLIWIFTFEVGNMYSIIPIINSLLSIYFIFYLKWMKLKIWFLFILVLWFIYNIIWHSIWGMISDIVLFISSLFWMYKILKENKEA